MKQRKLLKASILLFCVASLSQFVSCTKTDSGSGSSSGSNASLIVGKWKCNYWHSAYTIWQDGVQINYVEKDLETGNILEFHSDGTTNECVYTVQGSTLTMCDHEEHIDKLTASELHLTRILVLESDHIKQEWIYKYKYTRM